MVITLYIFCGHQISKTRFPSFFFSIYQHIPQSIPDHQSYKQAYGTIMFYLISLHTLTLFSLPVNGFPQIAAHKRRKTSSHFTKQQDAGMINAIISPKRIPLKSSNTSRLFVFCIVFFIMCCGLKVEKDEKAMCSDSQKMGIN